MSDANLESEDPRDPPFLPSNVLLALMPAILRTFFANKKIERPVDIGVPAPQGFLTAGSYWPGSGRVAVARGLSDEDALAAARHELLHALEMEYPRYQTEAHFGYPNLRSSLDQAGIDIPPNIDWPHTFTQFGDYAARGDENLPLPLQSYFAPLLPPIREKRGPR